MEKKKFYTDGIKTIKLGINDTVPENFYPGRTFKTNPWNRGLTKENSELVRLNTDHCHDTRRKNGTYDTSWNKGLTKDTNASLMTVSNKVSEYRKSHPLTEEQKLNMVNHIIDTKRKRGTFNYSKPEEDYYEYLLTLYSKDDIVRQYKDSSRYPFNCDFYIKSKDLFIECNYTWLHEDHPFDKNNTDDLIKLNYKLEKSKKSKYHAYAVKVWTEIDPLKLTTFRKNKLNFMIVYKNGLIIKE